MNNQWNNNQFQQGLPSQGNQVQMFDPTNFQTPSAYGGAQSTKSRLHARQQYPAAQTSQQIVGAPNTQQNLGAPITQQIVGAPNTQQNVGAPITQQIVSAPTIKQSPPGQAIQHASSVQHAQTSWSSWGSWDWNPDANNPQLGNHPQQNQPHQNQPQQVQQPESSVYEHQQTQNDGIGGNQYYGEGSTYSNTWNQGWDNSSQYSQPQQDYSQPDSGALYQSQETQPHQSQWDHQQYARDEYNQGQQDRGTVDQVQEASVSQQQNQLSFSSQFYDPQQPQQAGSDQGQVYDHGYGQYQSQPGSLYSESYTAGTWGETAESGQWITGNQENEQPFLNEQPLTSFQTSSGESIPQPSYTSQDTSIARPSFDVYNADDDGTVSGFFGRDDDGDVQLDSQRHDQSYGGEGFGNQGSNISSGVNQFLAVAPQFHRTDSGISNASLSTLNFSNSEDDDGRKHGQNLEESDLAQREVHDKNRSIAQPSSGDNSILGQPHNQDASRVFLQKQAREDYSEFSTNAYTLHNLPLEANIIPSSIGDHPDSAGSGESGGSSGLADWEIVPAQTDSANISHSSSLDNTTTFHEKPDGGLSMSSSYGNFDNPSRLSLDSHSHVILGTTSDDNIVSGMRNLDLSERSLPHEPQNTFVREAAYSHHSTVGQSVSSSVAPFTDHQQKNILTYTSPQPPPQASAGLQLSNIPLVAQPDGTTNQHRKDGRNIPTIPNSQNFSHTSSNALLSIQGPGPNDRKLATSAHSNLDLEKPKDSITTVPPFKQKTPATSEDGSCNSIRDNDPNMNFSDSRRSRNVFQNPEESVTSRRDQRHHSAFQPVSRQHSATNSATVLWDDSETPTANILLAPVIPLIIPALNPYSASAAEVAAQNTAETSAARTVKEHGKIREREQPVSSKPNTSDSLQSNSRVNEKRAEENKGKEHTRREDNDHSFDSLDEVDAIVEGKRDRSSRNQQRTTRELGQSHRQDPSRHSSEQPLSRHNQPGSRSEDDQYHYDSQYGRKEAHSKSDPYRRHHDSYYKDYGNSTYDDRYDRPRSRQDESHDSRPSSRSAQEATRPRSRADYDQERDYYNRAKQRGYGYDTYARNDYYNDEQDRYYRYSKEKEARYTRAYYEEYYGAKYAEYYKQLQQYQLQQQQYYSQGGRASTQSLDRSSSHSQSRGSTPAVVDSPGLPSYSPGPDYYGSRVSHQASHPDYSRDQGYNRGYSYDGYNAYYDGYNYGYPGYDGYNQAYDQGRLTPPKYSYPHVRASFGPGGQLVKVLPNRPTDGQPAILDILDIHMVLESHPEAEELRKFPGPLTRGTHKKDVLLFCQLKARACVEDINMIDRESAQLIWRFLELLIKQNGSVVGTDLSDLLLEGHELTTHEYSLHGMKISQSPESLDTVPEGNSESSNSARESPAVRVSSDRTNINTTDGERENWVDRFRHLLLYGRKKDALECAMKNNLWGHALFLASKMDTRTHANVMTRFANIAMRMNDPLQTLYQIMSGRQPAAVTHVVDDRWGDWRPHLAMILSNQSSQHETTCKSVTTLGDTLAAKGYLHASHFCYLMAQVNFGNYFKKTSKIVLIGSSHNLPMDEFATNDAIQCTEVYEYAQALGNPAFFLPHLQIYKFMYACRLTDYGMVSEALQYCEVIANNIQHSPTWFQEPFVRLVCQLSRQLLYADTQQQNSGEGLASPLWLQQLESLCGGYEDGSLQPLPGKVTPAGFAETTTSSDSGDHNQFGSRSSGDPGADVYGQQAQPHTEMPGDQDMNAVTGQVQNWESADQQGYYQQETYQQQQQYDYTQWQQMYGSHMEHPSYSSTQLVAQPHSQGYGGYDTQQQLPPRASVSTNETSEDDEDNGGGNDDDVLDGSSVGFDYFGNVEVQRVVAPPHRYRSMSGSSAGSTRRRRTTSGSSTGSVKVSPHKPATQQQPGGGKGSDKALKGSQQDSGKRGWFDGILNKFKTKDKNEMILPDDKNPPIVWDPVKERWTSSDGTEEDVTPKPPPPKDTEVLGNSMVTAPMSMAPPPSGLTEGNRFSLKAKGVRNQYVDVNNPIPVSVPQSLFPVVPGATLATVARNFPTPGQASSNETIIDSNTSHVENSLIISQGPVSHGSDLSLMASTSHQVPSMPTLFNPASLKGGSPGVGLASSAAGPGLKYGQRRAYPK